MRSQVVEQLARFGVVGVANTALTAATYVVLRSGGTPSLVAAPIGFVVGAANGFLWNGRWTFRARPPGAARRYLLVQLAALCATDALLAGGLPYVVVLACVTLCSFVACRRWAFRASITI